MTSGFYDVTIIGGGPGGYVAAIRAAQLGMKVALVEREHLGGVCLNWGCIPTKALLRNAEVARTLRKGGREFGFSVENLTLDYAAAVARSRKIAARLVKGVELLMRGNGIDVLWGQGRVSSPTEVEVALNAGGTQTLGSKAIILATGSRAHTFPNMQPDGERILTARHALERREAPASAVIIGAGPIGLEFATIWSAYGAAVTVVEMQEHILPAEDAEAAQVLARALRKQKIKTFTSTRVEGIEAGEQGARVSVSGSQTGTVGRRSAEGEPRPQTCGSASGQPAVSRPHGLRQTAWSATDLRPAQARVLEAELALVATGVRPNSESLGLEAVGVETTRGWVQVDDFMRTSVHSIYAIGDLNGRLPLAHVASAQGVLAVETLAGRETIPFDSNAIPRGTYTTPQVASFGLSEAQAQAQGLQVRVGRAGFLANGKALGLGENQGFVKIVAEEESREILGAVIVGPEATELLPELILARAAGLTPDEIARAVHAHPTLNEAVMEAAHGVFGKAIHGV